MIKGGPNEAYFEANDGHRYVPEISQLIEKYGEAKAGRYMWAIYLVYHPKSDLFDLPLEDRLEWVSQEYVGDLVMDWDSLSDVIRVFPKVSMEYEERMYHDAVMLYEESIRDARLLPAKDKAAFINAISKAGNEIDKLKSKYLLSRENVRSSGEIQSGWASNQKGRKKV